MSDRSPSPQQCQPHSPGSQPSPPASSDGDEQQSQPAEPASGRASPRRDAQPSRAEGEQREQHLEAVTEPGERLGEQGQGTGAASDGAVLTNGVDTALDTALDTGREQDGDTASPRSPELGDRGSPGLGTASGALRKERWHSALGSSEALSADEAEEQFG